MPKKTWKSIVATLGEDGLDVFFRGASHSMMVNVLAAGVGFLATLVLTRTMGAEQYGLYIYVLSWMTVASLTSQLGFKPVLLRFVAAYTATQQWGLARGVISHTTITSIGTSLVAVVVGAVVVWLAGSRLDPASAQAFLIGLPLVVLITIAALRGAALTALKRVVLGATPETIVRPILIALAVGGYAIVSADKVSASVALLVNVCASAAVFVIGTMLLLRVLPTPIRASRAEYSKREWWRMSLPMFFSIGMKTILGHADIIIVGSLVGLEEAGIYAVASRLAGFTIFGKHAADSIVAPMIAEFHATDERHKLSKLVIVSARTVTAFTLVAAAGLLILGPFILGLFGTEFKQGYAVLSLLLLGHFFKASFASAGFLLSMTGHQDQTAILSGVGAAINVILLFLLVPPFGLVGAGLAAAITNAIWSISLTVYAWKLLGINPTAFARIPEPESK